MAQWRRRSAGVPQVAQARVRRCTAPLTCLGRPCALDLTLGLSQLDPIPPCLSDVSRVEHGGTNVMVSLSLWIRFPITLEGENADG